MVSINVANRITLLFRMAVHHCECGRANNGIDEAFLYAPGTPPLIVDVDPVLFEFEAGQLPDGRTGPAALLATAASNHYF